MRYYFVSLFACCCLATGCTHTKPQQVVEVKQVVAPFQQFIAPNFDWETVKRVVLMPPANQTSFTKVGDEMFTNLAAEFQRAGRFDIVVANREDPASRAQDVFRTGEFNELVLLQIAREYGAQAVMFANITQYQPYTPPRVGLTLVMFSPAEGIPIASVDGVWDAREQSTATQAREYFKRTKNWPKSLIDVERAIESPDVFQRFVCEQAAKSLMPPPSLMPESNGSVPMMNPIQAPMITGDQMMSDPAEIPPVPPASMSIP